MRSVGAVFAIKIQFFFCIAFLRGIMMDGQFGIHIHKLTYRTFIRNERERKKTVELTGI